MPIPTPRPHRHDDEHDQHEHEHGLAYDLATLRRRAGATGEAARSVMGRRAVLGAGGVLLLAGCGTSAGSPAATTAAGAGAGAAGTASTAASTGSTGTAGTTAGGAERIPQETAGPYPGDGSNGPNVLNQSGIVRRDITRSFGSASGLAEGVPLTLILKITNLAAGGAAYAGAAVYAWQCDREGNYSLYSKAAVNENYLRGVQAAGADGSVTFTTIFPGAYPGRWPHIHFEVYKDLATATQGGRSLATSQVALPAEACNAAYTAAGYEASIAGMKRTTLANDGVFRDDGGVRQLAATTGDVRSGFTAVLPVPV